MRPFTRFATLALALAAFPAISVAQEPPSTSKEDGGAAPERSRIVRVKDWTIKDEVTTLTLSMRQFNGLIDSLTKANKDLGKEFKEYLNNQDNELLASRVEKKLAAYAANVSRDFDTVIASQDVFSSNFRNLRHKLGLLQRHLKSKSGSFKGQLAKFKNGASTMDKELQTLASRLKDPSIDADEKAKMKRAFAVQYRRYQMQRRYLKGYSSRYQGYIRLQKNMGSLSELFSSLHIKFEDLILNLENEKQYLKASIELQADALRIKKIIREGIVGGEKAITNVSKKLADLYLKVDTFNQVHDRISQQMSRFLDSQGPLLGVTEKINAIGGEGSSFNSLNKDLDAVIDDFAKKAKGAGDSLESPESSPSTSPEGAPRGN